MMDGPSHPLTLAIGGVSGRMGRELVRAAAAKACFRLVAGTERPESPAIGMDVGALTGGDALQAPILADPLSAVESADVFVDFSRPGASLAALGAFGQAPRPAVILGTTGFTPEEQDLIRAHARLRPIVQAANFGVGVNVLLGLVREAARMLGPEWDIEIAESHHRHKRDAPSGTALAIGQAAAGGRGARLDDLRDGPRDGPAHQRRPGAIGFAVRRAGGIIGDHEAAFVNEDEAVYLGHRALSRSLFAEGALRAALWVRDKPPGLWSMQDVLGFARASSGSALPGHDPIGTESF